MLNLEHLECIIQEDYIEVVNLFKIKSKNWMIKVGLV